MNRRLFREEALARPGRAEPLDVLLRVTAPHMWIVLAGLAVMLAGAIAWALLGQLDETVDADCALVLPGERHAVLSEATGTVEETLVDVGDAVQAGQPLARIRTPSLDRQLSIARAVLEDLEAQPDESGESATSSMLTAARAEVRQLEAMRATGQVLSSSVAGEVAMLDLVPGQAVEIGSQLALIRSGEGARAEAVAFVPQSAAQLIRTGHQATVVRLVAGGDALRAAVSDVSDRPITADDWLVNLGFSPPPRSHLVRLSLADQPSIRLADGEECRVRIVVRTHAPISLLGTAQPAGHGSV